MSESLLIIAIALVGLSGVPGLLFRRSSTFGQQVANAMLLAGAAVGAIGIGLFWSFGVSNPILRPWPIPGGEFYVKIDGISAFFLLPIFLVSALGSVYGLGYWNQAEHQENGRKLRLFYGLLTAGMALVVIARNGILFLFGWEIMAVSAFFLVTTEDRDRTVRETGWVYLVATHIATLCLFALFGLLRSATGSFHLVPLDADRLSSGMAAALFVCALIGFGFKAGIMPLHVWLPGAHATAPSHVSAILSGVMIKMGIYGLVRVLSLIPNPPPAWGFIVLGIGVVSGVLGVAFAIAQHDLKRLLAYHSIENIGIIVMGLGLALLGRSFGRVDCVALGLGGALLHVWNHGLFKSLLFLSAGSTIHATGTRDIDHLGGLAKKMPRTAFYFLVGAAAICGLPPLNGFVSEFLIYLGLFDVVVLGKGTACAAAALAAAALALIGALAVACFVKVFGTCFLGEPRSEHAGHAHESPRSMTAPMAVLAGCCFFIGLAPWLLSGILGAATAAWSPELPDAATGLAAKAPLGWLGGMAVVLLAAIGLGYWALRKRLQSTGTAVGTTWGCGYAAPTPRMQYTSSSFAQMLVGLFGWALRPKVRRPEEMPLFPTPTEFHSEVPDTVLDRAAWPAFRYAAKLLAWFRVFQQGSIQSYLLYIFITLLALLLWR